MTVGGEVPPGNLASAPAAHEDPDRPAEPPPPGPEDYAELLPGRGPLRTVLRAIGRVEQIIGASLIVVILVLVLIQVAQRYIQTFGGWPWTGEVARLALVWCTFTLAGFLMAQDRHITIKVLDLVLPERALSLIRLMSHLVVVATCLGMGYATSQLIAADIGQRTPAAGIPVAWVYVVPLVGYLLTAARGVLFIGLVDIRDISQAWERRA